MTHHEASGRDLRVKTTHGFDVRVRVQGEGYPLLLLNGLTRALESWETFVDAMDGRTLISVDAPGVGASPITCGPLSIPQVADIAVSVLDHLNIDRTDVLGFSYGGAVAQQLARSHPERVRRLVLVSTSCGLGTTLADLHSFDATAVGKGITTWTHVLGALWHSMAIMRWSSISFLGAIASPTLVICGVDDAVAPPANSRSLAQRIPDASLVMLAGGHDLQLSEPAKALAHCVQRFLVSDAATHGSRAAFAD